MRTSRIAILIVCLTCLTALSSSTVLQIAQNGTTTYRIVKPNQPTSVDDYAVKVLTNALHEITGVAFSVVTPEAYVSGTPAIFVGLSVPSLKQIGSDPLSALQDEEHIVRSIGQDLFLFGQGARGNLYAVMEFLENSLGWRWYSMFSDPVMPSRKTLTLEPFNRKRGFSFGYREDAPYFNENFYYQQGVNLTYRWKQSHSDWEQIQERGIMSALRGRDGIAGAHTIHCFIPPKPDTHQWEPYVWITKKDYFETNPEFFTMTESGVRTPGRQLCFSNRALRDELTRRVLGQIEREEEQTLITVGAMDTGGAFCHCPECKKLEQKYDAPGGPYFDYLLELSAFLKEKHPEVLLKGVAYRRDQSQKPPTLESGQHFPDNFVIVFAPIEDPYLGDWSQSDPGMQETYRDLQGWGKIASHVWVYYYPNPYGSGQVMPLGNVDRLIIAMRLMYKAGARGMYLEHASGVLEGANFTELLGYLFLKLSQDITCDTDAIIREFTDHQYGPAGALVRTYLEELEQGRKAIKEMPRGVTYSSNAYSEELWPYLTPENIFRWQGYFDQMEIQCKALSFELANVQRLRRNLDFATLFRWFDLTAAYPDYFADYKIYSARIKAVNEAKRADLVSQPRPLGERIVSVFESRIRGGGEKPLPAEFDGIDRLRIRTFMPAMHANNASAQGYFDDPDAAFGFAPSVHTPELPFNFGLYQSDTKKHGIRRSIEKDEITPNVYRLYKLGRIVLSPQSQIWFSSKSWSTKLELADLWEPGDPNEWDAYASIKFQGPLYGGEPVQGLRAGEVDLVLIDRVILVKHEDTR